MEELKQSELGQKQPKKKSLKWLWIAIALIVVAGIAVWCTLNAIKIDGTLDSDGKVIQGLEKALTLGAFLCGLFLITTLGYMLGRITIKGVSLGTAGVFLVAILFGFLCTLIPEDMPLLGNFHLHAKDALKGISASTNLTLYKSAVQNVGLVMFVSSVGFIAGPKFFRSLKQNFKTYILMGALIILSGTAVAVACSFIPAIGSKYAAGLLSGALTSTPGYSSALEASGDSGLVTLGYAVAYPFGVVGVVLFVQLMPKILKADMNYERSMLRADALVTVEKKQGLFACDDFGLMPIALAIVSGLVLGAITIPLSGNGYQEGAPVFSLGTTGGVLIMCLIFGHFGRIGKLSLEVPAKTAKVLREFGLVLFLAGAGVDGGVQLISQINANESGSMIVVYGLIIGAVMTIVPMVVGFFVGRKLLKLPLLNSLGSITGGMTSTPALGTLINTAETEDVASAYASTYPIALVLIVLACNLMIGLIP